MKIRNNEHGSALLMVLLLVVVFTILGMGLLSMNISATKQFNKKGEQVQARHLAEMGVLHYKAEVKKMIENQNVIIKGLNNSSISQEQLEGKINLQKHIFCSDLVEQSMIKENQYVVSLAKTPNCLESNKVNLVVISIGKPGSIGEARIEAKLTLTMPSTPFEVIGGGDGGGQGDNEATPETPSPGKVDNFYVERGTNQSIVGDLTIMKKLTSKPGKHATNIHFQNNLYIDGQIEINNHACIFVGEDFSLNKIANWGPSVNIFIYGNAYLPSGFNVIKKIFVDGDVYIGGKKLDNREQYTFVPNKFPGCGQSGTGNMPSNPSELIVPEWEIYDDIEATYH